MKKKIALMYGTRPELIHWVEVTDYVMSNLKM